MLSHTLQILYVSGIQLLNNCAFQDFIPGCSRVTWFGENEKRLQMTGEAGNIRMPPSLSLFKFLQTNESFGSSPSSSGTELFARDGRLRKEIGETHGDLFYEVHHTQPSIHCWTSAVWAWAPSLRSPTGVRSDVEDSQTSQHRCSYLSVWPFHHSVNIHWIPALY